MPRTYQNYGEAVVFNTPSATNMFLQQIERNKQNELMLNRQIEQSMATYDPDKIRSEDLKGFYDRYSKAKSLSMKYKDALRNPARNPDKINEIDAARNDLAAYMIKSKNRKDFQKQVDDFYIKNPDKVDLEDFTTKRGLIAAPLDSPEAQKADMLSIMDFQVDGNKFDPQKFYAPIYKENPMSIQATQQIGPGGEILTSKKRIRDINGTMNSISLGYDASRATQKGFEKIFNETTPDEKAALARTMQPIIPGFEINNPKDLAIALGMAGKMQIDMGQVQSGYTMAAQEAKSRRLQDRSAAISNSQWAQRHAITQSEKSSKKEGDWIPKMTAALKTGDSNIVQNYIGELSASEPTSDYGYMNMDIYRQDPKRNRELIEEIVSNRASNRDIPTADDVKKGIIYAKYPTKQKDANGNIIYKYIIASGARKDTKASLNRILNATRGTKKYEGSTGYAPIYEEGSLNDVDNEEMDNQDMETYEEE